jgi:hypothetical protein
LISGFSLSPHHEQHGISAMQSIYRDPSQSEGRRMRAAALTLPFESPKLAVTAVLCDEGARLERAILRSTGKLIDHPEKNSRIAQPTNDAEGSGKE